MNNTYIILCNNDTIIRVTPHAGLKLPTPTSYSPLWKCRLYGNGLNIHTNAIEYETYSKRVRTCSYVIHFIQSVQYIHITHLKLYMKHTV